MDTTEMVVPATAEFIPVIRSVVGGLAAMAELSIDDVEDLRLAATEACGYLLQLAPEALVMHTSVNLDHGIIQIVATARQPQQRRGGTEPDPFIMWHLLGLLTDGATMEWTTSGPAIRFHRVRG